MFVSQIFEECAEILGTTNSERVFRKISEAVQTLMESGHWSHSTAEVDICTGWDGCSIVLPRGVDTPLAINVDGSPVYFRNRLFQYHVNKGGMFSPVEWAWDDRGFTATAMEIIQPSQLIAIAEVENDVGKVIRVLGTNDGNIPLRSQLENGVGVDGLLVPINSVNDYPLGVILPPNQTLETRSVAIDPITRFTTTTPHQLDSGQGFNIASFTGTIPVPLSSGQVIYIGVIDAVTIQLFSDQNNAKGGNFPIELQSIINSGTLTIRDSKPSNVITALRFPDLPANEPSLPITTANPVAFPEGQTLPPPLLEKVTYFGNLIDPKNLQIFESFQDAQNNVNPVFTTGSTNPIDIDIRKEILPESKLTFSIQHFYKQGDQVQVYTAGGTLPNPLIANQNYFVNVIDEFTITLHESQADAIASSPTNPINPIKIIDAGVGSNFIVKLIASTFRSGELSQITAPGLNIPAPRGSGAQFQAVVTGAVRSISITSQGNGYTTVPQVTFSPPPEPPFGSGQEVVTATGFAIVNTISTKLEQIIILNPGLGYTSAPSITIDAPVGGPPTVGAVAQAVASATLQTSFVSYFRKISGGVGYTQAPQIQISGGGGSGATAQAVVNSTINPITQINAPSTTATATTLNPHGFSEGQIVTISGASPEIYNGNKTILTVPFLPPIAITSIVRTNTIALVTTGAVEHNYSTGQLVTISNAVTGVTSIPAYNGTFSIVVINPTQFQYTVTGSPANATSANCSVPDPAGNTFTFTVPPLTGNATVTGNVFSGEVVAVNVITSGTGYTSSPTVTITPSTGVFIEFSSTGSLPAPLISGVAYRAEAPLDTTNGVFTIKNADFSKVNITGGASGTFFTVLSRSFGINFTNRWLGDFSSLSTGDAIYFGTDFILPTTVPSVSSTVPRYLNVITSGVSRVYDTEVNANAGLLVDGNSINIIEIGNFSGTIATAKTASAHGYIVNNSVTITGATGIYSGYNKTDAIILSVTADTFTYAIDTTLPSTNLNIGIKVYKTTGLIQVVSFGVGQTYYGRRYSVSPLPYNDLIQPDSVVYLQEDEIVRVSTSGTLPSPLVAGTDYKVKLFGDDIKLFTMNGVLVPLLNAGVGQLSVDIERIITPSKSTQVFCERSLFETGQSINVRAIEGDSLPFPLVATTPYFVRRINENNFELYGTAAQAKATATTGRIEFQTPGNSIESTFFVDAVDQSVLVKSISQIEKPITDGFVLLYAWDYGRSNDMTLIGRYHPSEVNPQYRRLRIGKKCAWVRLAYRMSPPFITSIYDYIPIEHQRAIIAAIHACDLEDKDFADQATRYWGIAFNYLRNQQEYIDGHAMVPPQINNVTYGDGTDPVIF
jgi:hypothetical protein